MSEPHRAPRQSDDDYVRESYAVWEITLKCNLACKHCGSRAGDARDDELSTEEALDLVQQMAGIGITEVALIGGEAFLRPDWLVIARAIVDAGMICGMTTGGYGINQETARRMAEAGIGFVSVSIDGLETTHDELRGKNGSHKFALESIDHLRNAGIVVGTNTQINRLSAPELPRIYELLKAHGVRSWQIQMTVPMGNAADNHEILLQPCELLEFYPMLARVCERANKEGIAVMPGNSLGYFGPYEEVIRGHAISRGQFWMGCQAGLGGIGIEADGAVKACPSLPTDAYTGGNIRETRLSEIMQTKELTFNLGGGTKQGTKHLWGFCKSCEFAELCRGGCSWTAHVFFNKRGNNPYCHHRALELQKQGKRERVAQKLAAIGKPFDNGVFRLIEEPIDAPWPADDRLRFDAKRVVWPEGF